ncbi:hypothetical protein Syun_026146 [Stephania yunnanensis]|uniref:Uncharacterized protein n=1 Tax=Stephania yunnanensis TaxID=152371 RepID=A0AAP0ETR3_9MAGN
MQKGDNYLEFKLDTPFTVYEAYNSKITFKNLKLCTYNRASLRVVVSTSVKWGFLRGF